ncbi:Zinc finger protein-likeNoc [Orchesella cincta]|uniref:Zinc finger protein-likeNoc n=1 Tax=Orchesella cincta TaxID=48709 RepID=A0A1D2MRF4_ORCCI|nr:Zinc finger protein-likeNoc [Orchesella cincta]
MVILEGHNMLGVNSPNQYLQPDYLSPLPTTLDAKKSPLALLVQTCSQIGADPPSSKSLLHPSPLSSSDSTSSLSSSGGGGGQKRKASTSSDSGGGMSYKSLSSDSSNDSRPRSSGSTSSTCSSAKQPRLSSNMNTSSNSQTARRSASPNGKVSPKYTTHNNNNNNNNNDSPTGHKDIHYSHSKIRKLSGQSMSSETSEKNRNRSSPPNQNQQHHNHHNHHHNSSSVIVPQGKHSGSSSVGSRSPNPEKSSKSSEVVNTSSSSSSKHTNNNSSPKPPPTTTSSSSHHDQGQSPIIRSGLDVLQGKDLPKMSSGFGAFGYPPGFDPTNPAFRLPFLSSAHAAAAAHHAHLLGYPPMPSAGGPPGSSPYLAYSRVKSASGVESIVPVCKDPYCTGCQYSPGAGGMPPVSSASSSSAMNGLMAAAAAAAAANGAGGPSVCPAGCAQCDHQKFPLIPPSATSGPYASIPGFPPGISHAALAAAAAGYPQSFLSHPHAVAAAAMMQQQQQAAAAHSAAAAQQQNAQRPYICNWIVADSYCGKRFPSSEELLQHLRTHTNSSSAQAQATSAPTGSTDTASITSNNTSAALALAHAHAAAMQHPSSAAQMYSNALLNQSAIAAAMHRNYPTPPLSPHSAARYNPYAAAVAAASGKPPGSMQPHPSQHPALAGYYPSPYSIYGQRIG